MLDYEVIQKADVTSYKNVVDIQNALRHVANALPTSVRLLEDRLLACETQEQKLDIVKQTILSQIDSYLVGEGY